MWWLLAREVLRLRGTIPRTPDGWNVMVDMFFYRDPEEVEKQQQEEAQAKAAAVAVEPAEITDWNVAAAPAPGGIGPSLAQEGGEYSHFFISSSQRLLTVVSLGLDWSAEPTAGAATDWSAEPAAAGWGADAGAATSGWD